MIDDSSKYRANFLNQYAKIPNKILETLESRYSEEYESVRHCVGLIIVNLLNSGEVAYSRNKNFYTKNRTKRYTFANMLNALEIAVADGYAVRLQTGYHRPDYEKGWSSTLGAGPRLDEFKQSRVFELDVESLPLLMVDDRPVFEGDDLDLVKLRVDKEKQELRAFADRLDRVYDEALKLNRDYWNNMEIDTRYIDSKSKCFNRVGLTRIFNQGLMGRWFQKGEMSYQQLAKEERTKLRLNGESVVEIDYSAMHPHILYAWEGKQCPDDAYESIEDQCGCTRFIAKKVALYAINASSYKSLVNAINNNKKEVERSNRNRAIPEKILYDELKKCGITPKEVVEATKTVHPAISKYIYSASANKLMLVESDIMTDVLLKLKECGIHALPVHDSVIVQSRHENQVRQIMQEAYRDHTGFSILIK